MRLTHVLACWGAASEQEQPASNCAGSLGERAHAVPTHAQNAGDAWRWSVGRHSPQVLIDQVLICQHRAPLDDWRQAASSPCGAVAHHLDSHL